MPPDDPDPGRQPGGTLGGGTEHAAVSLPPATSSVSAARRLVADTLDVWGLDEAAWTAMQLVSELATNAVLHARTDYAVEVTRTGDTVRVAVRDASPVAPALRRYGQESTTGRGLRLVDMLSGVWGVEGDDAGKTIWFELDVSRSGTGPEQEDSEEVDLDTLLQDLAPEPEVGADPPRDRTSALTGLRLAA